jgi:hypothetical protein
MSFSRNSPSPLEGLELGAAMRGLGLRLGEVGGRVDSQAPIELTLASAVREALDGTRRLPDLRLLGVVVVWLERHAARVNVRHLNWLLTTLKPSPRAAAFWAAVGHWLGKQDARFRVLSKLHEGKPMPLVTDAEERAAFRGTDPRFDGGPLIVPSGLLRNRPEDVDPPERLAERHRVYRARVLIGPTYRADLLYAVQAELDAGHALPVPADLARKVGCAYGTAAQLLDDVRIAGTPRHLVA